MTAAAIRIKTTSSLNCWSNFRQTGTGGTSSSSFRPNWASNAAARSAGKPHSASVANTSSTLDAGNACTTHVSKRLDRAAGTIIAVAPFHPRSLYCRAIGRTSQLYRTWHGGTRQCDRSARQGALPACSQSSRPNSSHAADGDRIVAIHHGAHRLVARKDGVDRRNLRIAQRRRGDRLSRDARSADQSQAEVDAGNRLVAT